MNTKSAPARRPAAVLALILFITLAALVYEGRTPWCACGGYAIWISDVWSSHCSQHLLDPYSFTHLCHGLIFAMALGVLASRWTVARRFVTAAAIASAWEVAENSTWIIERYRAETMSLNYLGDSIVNAMGDIGCCALGFGIAQSVGKLKTTILFLASELILLFTIHDNLTLNVIMLAHPVAAIKEWQTAARGSTVNVHNSAELRGALASVKANTTILLAPGDYEGGLSAANVRGEAGKPVVIAAADPKKRPVIRGGSTGLHLSGAAHLELRDLTFEAAEHNGINLDDGGKTDTPAHHLTLRRLQLSRIGSGGNHDGIKLSGVSDFLVENCSVDGWGTGGGSGIDMVGCHKGVIENCNFKNTDQGGTGVQMKGGSGNIVVRRNRFESAGSRAINIGGSTGREYFRPALVKPPFAEARDITIEGNLIRGSEASLAFVGVDGATVRFNTLYVPVKWAIRILQETRDDGFVACRNGKFTDNIIVFRSTQWGEGGVNVGSGTEPSTFTFERNVWYCDDTPARSKPRLPVTERDGVYGTAPKFKNVESGDFHQAADSATRNAGMDGLR